MQCCAGWNLSVSTSDFTFTTESLPLGVSVGLAVVLTQIEATVLTVVVTVLVMYCCCKTVRVKKTRTLEVEQENEIAHDYDELIGFGRRLGGDVVMRPSPAYEPGDQVSKTLEAGQQDETGPVHETNDGEKQPPPNYVPVYV